MTASIRHRMEQELRASQLHFDCTEPPGTSSTNPSLCPQGDSDSDFETESYHKFKQSPPQHLDEFDDENELKCGVASHAPKQWGELDPTLQSVLPPDYTYLVEHHQELPKGSYSGAPKFVSRHINLQNEEHA